jgi:transposase
MPPAPSIRTVRIAEKRAINRAADLAKAYAERYEAEARTTPHKRRRFKSDDWSAEIKAGHWRIIEKAIRALVRKPETPQ